MKNNLGNIMISEDAINSMVVHIIDGVEGLHTKSSITEKVINKSLFVSSKIENDKIEVFSTVEANFGLQLMPLIKETQKKIKEELETITSLEVSSVNIKIVNLI